LTARLAAALPDARTVQVTAGHMRPITHSTMVNTFIADFLRCVDAGCLTFLAISLQPPTTER
jgi:hypothetical protein